MRIKSSLSRSSTFSTAYSIAFVASIRDESVSKKSRGFAAFTILDRCPSLDLEDDMDEMHRIQAVRKSPARKGALGLSQRE